MAPSDYKNFTPKNAIVTGAAQGIGRAIALRLAADGLNLVLNDLPKQLDLLDTLIKELTSLGVKAVAYTGDITEKAINDGLVSTCVKEFGSLDVMVCNAGIAVRKDILDTTYDEFEAVLKVNFKSQWLGYNAAAEQMIKQNNGGRIIGAGSVTGKQGFAVVAAYGATKFSSRALTQSAAQEWGQYGITVNSYCPGCIRTELTCALKRLGEPEEIASAVSFFASKDSRYVTGQSLSVDGGYLYS
ncbi:putative short chain oxidoreductase [Cylindrobasidium torrendii FP15055 ss-10]|uniref:Putative short chain oxidoreductase n=1 Tax=Cylindrobasidium torrendii FP15055 ss-10 TaxID=1314674 RepID=A0A0D7AWU7_9AGAR|nr:putative short chain oxidoreductase [Cylindrobasidium torrendii FP15055 ss-10]